LLPCAGILHGKDQKSSEVLFACLFAEFKKVIRKQYRDAAGLTR
jgi:hypothetical protein